MKHFSSVLGTGQLCSQADLKCRSAPCLRFFPSKVPAEVT